MSEEKHGLPEGWGTHGTGYRREDEVGPAGVPDTFAKWAATEEAEAHASEVILRADEAAAEMSAGVPLPAGLRFRWKDDDGDIVEVVVLPGSGRDYRATMEGRGAVEGMAPHEQLRAWYEARE